MEKKAEHSKVKGTVPDYLELKLADYLAPNEFTSIDESQYIFTLKTQMTDLAGNMPYKYDSDQCMCGTSKETQNHVYQCKIFESKIECKTPNYSELFGTNLEIKVKISTEMKRRGEIRRVLLSAQEK